MKCLTMFFAFLAMATAQGSYTASASTTALTIQQNTVGPTVNATGKWALLFCAAASVMTPSWNGTAASSTTLATKRDQGIQRSSSVTAWSASNVGGGTSGQSFDIPASAPYKFDITNIKLGPGTSLNNFTISTDLTCRITIAWDEK